MSQSKLTYRLYLVPSASYAIKGENVLIQAGIACSLMPLPRTISTQCGVCLRVSLELGDRATEALQRAEVQISGTHDF
jgi:hypothetical protein